MKRAGCCDASPARRMTPSQLLGKPMADGTRVVRVRIKGLVQGVNYRAWTAGLADGLGLTGWVRNRADGTVEALFAGAGPDVEAMLGRCREGPSAARVKEVVIEAEGGGAPKGFVIRPTV